MAAREPASVTALAMLVPLQASASAGVRATEAPEQGGQEPSVAGGGTRGGTAACGGAVPPPTRHHIAAATEGVGRPCPHSLPSSGWWLRLLLLLLGAADGADMGHGGSGRPGALHICRLGGLHLSQPPQQPLCSAACGCLAQQLNRSDALSLQLTVWVAGHAYRPTPTLCAPNRPAMPSDSGTDPPRLIQQEQGQQSQYRPGPPSSPHASSAHCLRAARLAGGLCHCTSLIDSRRQS